jgi:ribosome-binding factor A
MDERRTHRVSQAVKEELAEIIGFEMDDPRIRFVDVSDVQVSPDGRHAHVRVVAQGEEPERRDAMEALDHARHFLQHELAVRLTLRKVPELHFQIDRWADVDSRIDVLLKRAKKRRVSPEKQS